MDDSEDLDIFDQLAEDSGEGREEGQPEVDQSPAYVPADVLEEGSP